MGAPHLDPEMWELLQWQHDRTIADRKIHSCDVLDGKRAAVTLLRILTPGKRRSLPTRQSPPFPREGCAAPAMWHASRWRRRELPHREPIRLRGRWRFPAWASLPPQPLRPLQSRAEASWSAPARQEQCALPRRRRERAKPAPRYRGSAAHPTAATAAKPHSRCGASAPCACPRPGPGASPCAAR